MKLTRGSILGTATALTLFACCAGQAATSFLEMSWYTSFRMDVAAQGQAHQTYATALLADRTGGDNLPSGHSDPFITFCLDINNVLGSGLWRSGGFSDAEQSTGAQRQAGSLYRAANLYQHFAPALVWNPSDANMARDGAALQLAIWEVLYETSGTFDVNQGDGFKVMQAYKTEATLAVRNKANEFLASQYAAIDLNLETTFWNAVKPDGSIRSSQDLIGPVVATGVPVPPVPEPSTYFAGALLLLPLLASGIRVWRRR